RTACTSVPKTVDCGRRAARTVAVESVVSWQIWRWSNCSPTPATQASHQSRGQGLHPRDEATHRHSVQGEHRAKHPLEQHAATVEHRLRERCPPCCNLRSF